MTLSGAPVTQSQLQSAIKPIETELKSIDAKIDEHLLHSAKQDQRLDGVAESMGRVRDLEDWRIQVETYGRIAKMTLGTSLITAILGLINLFDLVNR